MLPLTRRKKVGRGVLDSRERDQPAPEDRNREGELNSRDLWTDVQE